MKLTMMIVEDDNGLRTSLEKSFSRKGWEVLAATAVSEAQQLLRERKIDLILLDHRLPDGTGMKVLSEARELDPDILVIMFTAFPEVKTAVKAMKEGAHDFIIKPFELEELHLAVERAVEARSLREKVRHLEHERESRQRVTEILGESPAVEKVRDQIRRVAIADTPVLITGTTGTGKELVADCIHRLSSRSEGALVKVNCSSFSEQLLESELFGHERGAFTDARQPRAGLFEMADGGTLVLDEISEMRPELQAKLLRVVEGHPFRRLGGEREIKTDVRILASTNRDLQGRIRSGLFREDLFFRLNVFRIEVPLLRERGADIILLARFGLHRSSVALRKGPLELSKAAEEMLMSYDWPGNVRELLNVVERAVIVCDGDEVGIEHLPTELQASAFVRQHASAAVEKIPTLADIEYRYVNHVLETADGNLTQAARILGVARNTLKARLRSTDAE
ncbi:MAG: sigma-54 dependent transcriptional regulator [Planctomycetota bacterium]|jgi:DNA-binding NtrC family response regulator|nr:sigma-54 dependent transcriptional regulator [Planctomycetota bacterium]MDP7129506.1 sigma-54 dependent transcriptional regulator [Planctomycetota bacterium]MDP7250662.1 sigma-54 dependent transcriptional regulator [Planctomycetota bacterium]